jgi:hypothetical protein
MILRKIFSNNIVIFLYKAFITSKMIINNVNKNICYFVGQGNLASLLALRS